MSAKVALMSLLLLTVWGEPRAGADEPGRARSQAPIQQDSTAVLRTLGENIFKGKAANGLCYTCHQVSGKGIRGLGPDLTDASWLHGDGSLDSIAATIEKGVAKPREASVPMLPGGGARLTRNQIRALAIYVKSLSAAA